MTKVIGIIIVALAAWGGWAFFKYYQSFQQEEKVKKEEAAALELSAAQLPGLPPQLAPSLQAAEQQGVAAMKNWLRRYGRHVKDPSKAWIELDYCVMLARDNPAEAKRIFAEVKGRTPETSPVWPRLKELGKSYE